MSRIITVCLSAGIQKTIFFKKLEKGSVNRSFSYRFDAAGKAVNSGRILNQLAEKEADSEQNLSIICPLGERNASFFMELAERDRLPVKSVLMPGFTRECCTLIDTNPAAASSSVTELVVEEPPQETPAPEDELMQMIEASLSSAEQPAPDALLLAGSRPAVWPQSVISRIALAAKNAGALFMADFRGKDLAMLLSEKKLIPDIIKINEAEFRETFPELFSEDHRSGGKKASFSQATSVCELASVCEPATNADKPADEKKHACAEMPGCTGDPAGSKPAANADKTAVDENIAETELLAAAVAQKSLELENIIIVTRGADATIAAKCGERFVCATEQITPLNTIGCGDSFNAGFLYEYLKSCDMEKSLLKGTWCAARNAETSAPSSLH